MSWDEDISPPTKEPNLSRASAKSKDAFKAKAWMLGILILVVLAIVAFS